MKIKGTKTEKNLLASFAGESQARSRYKFFASKARKEGYEQIAAVFEETAEQEKEHAERFFKFLEGGMVEITSTYPAGVIGDTVENLRAAAAGENEEWSELYPHFADVAEEEGFKDVATAFRKIMEVEAFHEQRYLKLLERVRNGSAATAVMCSKVRKLLRHVRHACILRHISNPRGIITDNCGICRFLGKTGPAHCAGPVFLCRLITVSCRYW